MAEILTHFRKRIELVNEKEEEKNCELGEILFIMLRKFYQQHQKSGRRVKEEEEDKMNKILWNVLMSAKALLFGGKNAKNERERKFCLLKNLLVLGSFSDKNCVNEKCMNFLVFLAIILGKKMLSYQPRLVKASPSFCYF